jgi:4-cresol dehydrogenase (hydroxylating) cytochrome subunit
MISNRATVAGLFNLALVTAVVGLALAEAAYSQEPSAKPPAGEAKGPAFSGALRRGQGWERAGGQWGDGQMIFQHTCGLCHKTGIGPELRGRQLSPERIVTLVRYGGLAMPAIRPSEMNDAELARVAQWISESPTPAKGGL